MPIQNQLRCALHKHITEFATNQQPVQSYWLSPVKAFRRIATSATNTSFFKPCHEIVADRRYLLTIIRYVKGIETFLILVLITFSVFELIQWMASEDPEESEEEDDMAFDEIVVIRESRS